MECGMEIKMDIQVSDTLNMKKMHPCKKQGSDCFEVLRIGMDIRVKCMGCNRSMIISREKLEKNIKKIVKNNT